MMTPRLRAGVFLRSLLRILRGRPQTPASLADNALLQTILQRRSVRSFGHRDIPDDVFAAILEAGRLAPSTVNLQTWTFAPFDAASWRATFGRPIPFSAPRAIIIMADFHRDRAVLDVFPRSPLVEYTLAVMNASLAAMNMNIAAEALGVASVMLSETGRSGFLDAGYLRQILKLPAGVVPLTTLILGYARGPRPPMPPKLPLTTITCDAAYVEANRDVMQDWLAQMIAGYQASHLTSSFDDQLRVYQGKIGRAEADLRALVFGAEDTAAQP